ncbi:hypothetical protein [Streptomyces sp. MUM 2J]|nr:hypothetical protein [Streptomyces sp. MUM 2J]MCH0566666.1 hypothetical protein [Streptomyces sp. MUM 2J]
MIRLLYGGSGPEDTSPSPERLCRSRIAAPCGSRTHQGWFTEHYVGI